MKLCLLILYILFGIALEEWIYSDEENHKRDWSFIFLWIIPVTIGTIQFLLETAFDDSDHD